MSAAKGGDVNEAASPGGPDYTLNWTEVQALTIRLMDQNAQELVRTGRFAEAIGVYTEDIEQQRAVTAAVRKAGVPADPQLERAKEFRTAHAVRNIGMIEGLRIRVQPALDLTAQAVETLASLDRDQREPIVHDELIHALYSFAFVRAWCRTRLADAAEAIAAADRMMDHVAAEGNPLSDDFRAAATRLGEQISTLSKRQRDGTPAGIPGAPLPGDGSGFQEFSSQYQQKALEQLEVPDLLRELRNADQAEALLRNMDERGDAEGARKRGQLLEALDDLNGAEAAYRRGIERGSGSALYCLGELLKGQGDTQGAIAAFTQAAESDDAKLSADAQRQLRKLARARRIPWSRP